MNDEIIASLIIELDKVLQYVPEKNTFTSVWLENEYAGVVSSRNQEKSTLKNEYRIIQILKQARLDVLVRNDDKLLLFIPASKIIKTIEDNLKEQFNTAKKAGVVGAIFERMLNDAL